MSERESDLFSPSVTAWFNGWLAEDFSWNGLEKFPAWQPDHAANLKEYLRSLDQSGPADDELLRCGRLVECKDYGTFHILFVPEEWAAAGLCGSITSDNLRREKQAYWQRLRADRIPEGSSLTISGAQLDEELSASVTSGTRASFVWTRFGGEPKGVFTWGNRSFRACHFARSMEIGGRLAGDNKGKLYFTSCQFDGEVDFKEADHIERVEFSNCNLTRRLRIDDRSIGIVRFDQCALESIVADETTFEQGLVLANSSLDSIQCTSCRFNDHVLVRHTKIRVGLGFLGCDFLGRVTFVDVTWPSASYRAASSSGSKYYGIVEIGGSYPPPVQLFQNAEFASRVAFRGYSDRSRRAAFRTELKPHSTQQEIPIDRDKHAAEVESGCRTLRKIAESEGDVQTEHLWHRAELIARRARGEGAISEQVVSYLYQWLADYGLSISRPFLAVVILAIGFGLLYGWLAGPSWVGAPDYGSIEQGLGYSLNRTLPIGVFADEGNTWRQHLLGSGGQLRFIGVRAVATAQTILSIILIYLGVMAVRRKFRIS